MNLSDGVALVSSANSGLGALPVEGLPAPVAAICPDDACADAGQVRRSDPLHLEAMHAG